MNKNSRVFLCATRILSRDLCNIFLWFSKLDSIILDAISSYWSCESPSFYVLSLILDLFSAVDVVVYFLTPINLLSMFWNTLSFRFYIKYLRAARSFWSMRKMPFSSISKQSLKLFFIMGLYKSWNCSNEFSTINFSSSLSINYSHVFSYCGISTIVSYRFCSVWPDSVVKAAIASALLRFICW